MPDLAATGPTLLTITRTDPDPRVRHRADALLLVANGRSLAAVARDVHTSSSRLRAWRDRFLADGRDGLQDRPRSGRPPKLDAAAETCLITALASSPMDHDYPVTMWTVADLADHLGRQGWTVHSTTVSRALARLGYRYRRPRHDLTHRQDVEAVASAKQVLTELQKRGLLPDLDSGLSIWMNVPSTPTPTWQRCGNSADSR